VKTIDKEQIIKGIERANPWWAANTGNTGSFNHLPKRMHFDRLYKLTTQNTPLRALVLMGPRRVGKTVLIYQLINQLIEDGKNPKKIMYLSLDNPLFRFSSLEDLLNWGIEWAGTSTNDVTIFFDEIQYIDTWEQQLKVLVDSYRHIKFVVTGPAAAVLHKKSKESGAGRFTDYLLPSLSFYEYIFIKSKMENTPSNTIDLARMNAHYLDYLNYGGFPESITSEQIRNQPELYIGQDILDKVLGRDLPSIYGITNPSELQKLFAALAYNTSNEISPESISKQSGVSKAEIGRYIQFFESSFLIRVIEKTDDTLKKFQRKTHFKIVLTNPSLRSAIFGKISSEDKDLEALAETAIFSQLIGPEGKYLPYKYARWNRGGSKGEVDLVHINLKGDVISALEIKWSDRFASGEEKPKSLIAFCLENKLNTAIMTSKTMFAETKLAISRLNTYLLQ
jgi:predicted AAA+ superfamily ATPase